jgi:hypothetical protein
MLSKLYNPNGPSLPFTYIDYINNQIDIHKFTIPDLKVVLRAYKLPVSGNKPSLIERLEHYFKDSKYAEIIQKYVRRHFVKRSFALRGEALLHRKICVNDTDFYTMEPLVEISAMSFFSYKDENGYIYGFDMISLLQWIKQKPLFINPYNREKISVDVKNRLFHLCKLIKIICSGYLDKETMAIIAPIRPSSIRFRPRLGRRLINVGDLSNAIMENIVIQSSHSEITTTYIPNTGDSANVQNTIFATSEIVNPYHEIIEKMRNIRSKSIHTRMIELFMEIDNLGNYTQSSWFSNLAFPGYILLYQKLYDIWNFQGIPYNIKRLRARIFDTYGSE